MSARGAALALLACLGGAALPAASAFGAEPLRMTEHTIIDSQGYGGPVEALGLLVPRDWETRSAVLWAKPCSGGDLFDVRLSSHSQDRRTGIKYLPALRFEALSGRIVGPGDGLGIPPQESARIFQQSQAQFAAAMQGTNCHPFAPRTAREVVERLILPSRPAGTQIVDETPLPDVAKAKLASLRQILMASGYNQGDTPVSQASLVKVRYPGRGGMLEEVFYISFGGFLTVTPMAPGFVVDRAFILSDPVISYWAPEGVLDANADLFRAIAGSMRPNPRWAAANSQVRRNIAEINRKGAEARQEIFAKAQREISDSSMESWRRRQASSDYLHEEFMETVNETERLEDPSGGIVEMPSVYDDYYTNGEGDYVGMPAGVDPAEIYPDSVWTEMPRYEGPS
ncbi:MAG: hypothetical protein AAF321_05765 [Pseudomonadota bacterium]